MAYTEKKIIKRTSHETNGWLTPDAVLTDGFLPFGCRKVRGTSIHPAPSEAHKLEGQVVRARQEEAQDQEKDDDLEERFFFFFFWCWGGLYSTS